jgi:hypothetical protein
LKIFVKFEEVVCTLVKNLQNACRRKIIDIADNCFNVDKVITCVIDLCQVDGLIQVLRLSSPMKQPKHFHNTTYILLKIVSFYFSKCTLENINYLLKSIMSLAHICRMILIPCWPLLCFTIMSSVGLRYCVLPNA